MGNRLKYYQKDFFIFQDVGRLVPIRSSLSYSYYLPQTLSQARWPTVRIIEPTQEMVCSNCCGILWASFSGGITPTTPKKNFDFSKPKPKVLTNFVLLTNWQFLNSASLISRYVVSNVLNSGLESRRVKVEGRRSNLSKGFFLFFIFSNKNCRIRGGRRGRRLKVEGVGGYGRVREGYLNMRSPKEAQGAMMRMMAQR